MFGHNNEMALHDKIMKYTLAVLVTWDILKVVTLPLNPKLYLE